MSVIRISSAYFIFWVSNWYSPYILVLCNCPGQRLHKKRERKREGLGGHPCLHPLLSETGNLLPENWTQIFRGPYISNPNGPSQKPSQHRNLPKQIQCHYSSCGQWGGEQIEVCKGHILPYLSLVLGKIRLIWVLAARTTGSLVLGHSHSNFAFLSNCSSYQLLMDFFVSSISFKVFASLLFTCLSSSILSFAYESLICSSFSFFPGW